MMVSKRRLHKAQLGLLIASILLVISIALSVVGLISNSQNSKQLYDTLIATDESGGDVEKALNDLRSYIYGHMNTKIGSDLGINPPIQLRGTYQRLVDAEAERVKSSSGQIYSDAQIYCERTQPEAFFGRDRLGCIEKYVDENSVKTNVIQDDFYKFDFVPPVWSPDLAGFSILASIVIGLWVIVELFIYLRLRSLSKHK